MDSLAERHTPLSTDNRFASLSVEDTIVDDELTVEVPTTSNNRPSPGMCEITNVNVDKEHNLLRIEGRIDGHKAIFLVDSGSTHDFLSEDFVNKHSIQKVDDTLHVTLADGFTSEQPLRKTGDLKVNMDGHGERQSFTVFSLQRYDAILGKPWLTRHNPGIDFRTHEIKFSSSPSTITAVASRSPTQHSSVQSLFLSGSRASRELRRGGSGVLV